MPGETYPSVRSRYAGREGVTAKSAIDCGEESIVQQQFRDEVDVNTIVRRFGLEATSVVGEPSGIYGDFTGITDFESALEAVARVQASFMAFPAEVRARFNNNPQEMLEFVAVARPEELEALHVPPVKPAPGAAAGSSAAAEGAGSAEGGSVE